MIFNKFIEKSCGWFLKSFFFVLRNLKVILKGNEYNNFVFYGKQKRVGKIVVRELYMSLFKDYFRLQR